MQEAVKKVQDIIDELTFQIDLKQAMLETLYSLRHIHKTYVDSEIHSILEYATSKEIATDLAILNRFEQLKTSLQNRN